MCSYVGCAPWARPGSAWFGHHFHLLLIIALGRHHGGVAQVGTGTIARAPRAACIAARPITLHALARAEPYSWLTLISRLYIYLVVSSAAAGFVTLFYTAGNLADPDLFYIC